MPIRARYAHTNIVARDWKRLVKFYQEVFGCEQVGPERKHRGKWIEEVTAVEDAEIDGVHLRMPGYEGDHAPTLEIFQYHRSPERPDYKLNTPGFAHIAFEVEDVEAARRAVIAAGGRDVGKLHTADVPNAGRITIIYMADPEGNVLELQHWS